MYVLTPFSHPHNNTLSLSVMCRGSREISYTILEMHPSNYYAVLMHHKNDDNVSSMRLHSLLHFSFCVFHILSSIYKYLGIAMKDVKCPLLPWVSGLK